MKRTPDSSPKKETEITVEYELIFPITPAVDQQIRELSHKISAEMESGSPEQQDNSFMFVLSTDKVMEEVVKNQPKKSFVILAKAAGNLNIITDPDSSKHILVKLRRRD